MLILRQVYHSIHPHTYSESKNRVTLQKEQRTFHVMLVDLLFHRSLSHTAIGPFARCHPYNHFLPIIAAWRPFHGKFIGSSADILLMAFTRFSHICYSLRT